MNISESVPDLCMTLNNLDYRQYVLKLFKITKEKSATMVQRCIKFGTSSFCLCILFCGEEKRRRKKEKKRKITHLDSFVISKRFTNFPQKHILQKSKTCKKRPERTVSKVKMTGHVKLPDIQWQAKHCTDLQQATAKNQAEKKSQKN